LGKLFASLAPIGWIDSISSFVHVAAAAICVRHLSRTSWLFWETFASLAPIGWIDPINSFVSGRGRCNLCAARVAYLSFCFACSYWLD
jgi:hypothetical protein